MRISRTMLGLFIVTILFVLTLAARAAGQPAYRATELGTIGGDQSEAYAINDYAEVVGRSFDASGEGQVFYWQNGEMLALFHELPWGYIPMPITRYSVAYGMSNTGYVITYVMDESEEDPSILIPGAVLFRPTPSDVTTPYPGQAITYLGEFCSPTGISSSGRYVVGWGHLDCTDQVRGFLVTPSNGIWALSDGTCIDNSLMISLGTLDALDTISTATAVNNYGQVVGWSYSDKGGYQAFLLNPALDVDGSPITWFADGGAGDNGLMSALGALPAVDGQTFGINSWARDINDAGLIVGEADTGDYETHAFLYRYGAMLDLGTLGGAASSACAITEAGQIVGWAYNAAGARRAFVIIPSDADGDGQPDTWYLDADADGLNDLMVDLNGVMTSGFKLQLTEARDVNLNGQIVGWGVSGTGADAVRLAFLLTPTEATTTAGDDGGSDGGSQPAVTDAALAPLLSDPSDGSSDPPPADPEQPSASPLHFGLAHWLCGASMLPLMPVLLAGLCAMKLAMRRR
jgi:probable HAF family extracellular repeat protein